MTPNGCLTVDDCLSYLEGRPDGPSPIETQAHLDDCGACRVLMAESVRATVDANRSAGHRALHTLEDGQRIGGRYDIRRFVARGGMGEVYEAFDSLLGERIALKTLLLTATDRDDAVDALLREVRIARKVNHVNVCRILELGVHRFSETSSGAVPFLTMDFLTGETLAQRLARVGPLSADTTLKLMRDLTAGLASIHAAGIVHRDFKSDNVFLVAGADGAERAVVMDFGLARAPRGSRAESSSGQGIVGTAAYVAPEQLRGQPASAPTDIYALGIVMFEMLTGRLPFSGDSPAATALARLHQVPPKPSSIVAQLDPRWNTLVERCLEPEPRRRLGRIEDVTAMLDRLASPRPRRPPVPRVAVAVGAGALALIAAAIGLRARGEHELAGEASIAPARATLRTAAAPPTSPEGPVAIAPTTHAAPARAAEPRIESAPKKLAALLHVPDPAQRATPRRPPRPGPPARLQTATATTTATAQPPGGRSSVPPAQVGADVFSAPAHARPSHPDDLIDPF